MNKYIATGAALMLTTSMASAGGLDRSGQPVSVLFEDGTYAEVSFGMVMPSVSGSAFGLNTGNMAQDYNNLSLAYKTDMSDRVSVAVIFEQTYGAAIDYTNADAGYPVPPVTAELSGYTFAALARYEVNDRFSVHGGLRYVTMSGEIDLTAAGGPVFDYQGSSDIGYTVGASYEIPDIALRASLTYNSATTHNHDYTVGGFPAGSTGAYNLPQSVALDFQTGIAQNTLLLASVRWAEWSDTVIHTMSPLGDIDYDYDVTTYKIGVARRFNETFAGVATITYEAANGTPVSNLAPTDGSTGLTLAGIYTLSDQVTITGGINYTWLGDATTEGFGGDFSDNSAIGVGVKIGYTF